MINFIFMLTLNDETVPNAHEVYDMVRNIGVEYVGFKDIGLPMDELKRLTRRIQADGKKAVLEVVSLEGEEYMNSIRAGLVLDVDFVIGGNKAEPIILERGIEHYPYIGQVIDHPAKLRGSIDEIIQDAARKIEEGTNGFNLLAYRYNGNVEELVKRVVSATDKPIICAGSITSIEQIEFLQSAGVWGFTIGGAIIEKKVIPGKELVDQVIAVVEASR